MSTFSIPNFLLKKTLGVVDAFPAETNITKETPGVALNRLFYNQLNSLPIPSTAPTAPTTTYTYSNTSRTLSLNTVSTTISISSSVQTKNTSITPDLVFTGYIDSNGGITATSTNAYGLLFTSKTYPWIQYVDRLQITINYLQTYSYSFGPIQLLSNSIPFNYDPGSTYTITISPSLGSFNNKLTVPQSEYIIEKDAGYIYFINSNWSTPTLSDQSIPLISFYRYNSSYNGAIGIPTNIGSFAGAYYQGTGALAYGSNAGYTGQGMNSIAIGTNAGNYGQGTGSIAIGYLAGPTGMTSNSIALNASGVPLSATGPTGGFYVAPVASYSGSQGPFKLLAYGADKQIVTVTGATGLNLSLSTPTVTYDSWLLTNLIGAPPAISLSVDKITTTDAYIIFSYPSQFYSGISTSGLLPYINNMFVNLYNSTVESNNNKNDNGVTGTNFLNAISSSTINNFIAKTTPVDSSTIVQCINISKTKENGLSTYTTASTKLLKTYTIKYSSLTPGEYANFYLWYSNNNPNNNIATINFKYNTPQSPTYATNLTITPNLNNQTITISFTSSTMIDSGDSLSTAKLNYNIKYYAINGSNTFRYGGTYDTSRITPVESVQNALVSTTYSQDISDYIYPDTAYYVTLNASNTNYNGYTGTTGTTILNSTTSFLKTVGPPLVRISDGQTDKTTSLTSAKSVYYGTTVNNLLKTSADIANLNFKNTYNIHNDYLSRGSTGSNLITFNTNLSGFTGGSVIQGPTYSLNGFSGTYNYPETSANGISISATNFNDQYSSNGMDGYYLQSDINISMASSILYNNSNQYKLSVTGTYAASNSGKSYQTYRNFYYDGETITPKILGFTGIFNTTACTQICGVTGIISSTVTLKTSVTGIGNYFYNSDKILSYTNPNQLGAFSRQTETDLTNLTTGTGPTGFKYVNTFVTNVTTTPSTYYNGSLSYSVNAYNIKNETVSTTFTDNKSYILFNDNLISIANTQASTKTSIPNVDTTSAVNGVRIWSCNPGYETDNSSINNISNNGNSYTSLDPLFDNKQSLVGVTGSTELLLWSNNGKSVYQSIGTQNTNGYIDYSSSYYSDSLKNTVNYNITPSSSLRYATFAWKVDTSKLTASGNKNIQFILKNVPINNLTTDDNWGSLLLSNIKLSLFYRVEQLSSIYLFDSSSSTPWIDGNLYSYDTSTVTISSSNFNSKTIKYTGLLSNKSVSIDTTNANVTFNVILGNPLNSDTPNEIYIYTRIGIPTNLYFYFENITCKLV